MVVVVEEGEGKQMEGLTLLQVCLVVFSAQEKRKEEFFIIQVIMWPLQPKMLLDITFVLLVLSLKRSLTSLFKDSIRQECLAWIVAKSPYLPVLTLFFF